MLRALIFDFDGTIVDTETPEYEAWCALYQEHGCDLPMDQWAQAVGTRDGFDPVRDLEGRTGRTLERTVLLEEHRSRVRRRLTRATTRPGVDALLRAAAASGLVVGLASSSRRAYIEAFLERLQLTSAFATLCTADDVALVKPHPALYVLALERLGVAAREAVAIEDSPNGVRAAQAAGIACLVVPNPVTRQFRFPDYGMLLSSLSQTNLSTCQQLCSSAL